MNRSTPINGISCARIPCKVTHTTTAYYFRPALLKKRPEIFPIQLGNLV